jgi:hypothetical protein
MEENRPRGVMPGPVERRRGPRAVRTGTVLFVSVANDVHDVAVGCADEESPHTPSFDGQRVNDLVAAALRVDVRLVDIVTDAH